MAAAAISDVGESGKIGVGGSEKKKPLCVWNSCCRSIGDGFFGVEQKVFPEIPFCIGIERSFSGKMCAQEKNHPKHLKAKIGER